MIILLPLINICGGRYTRHTSRCMYCVLYFYRNTVRKTNCITFVSFNNFEITAITSDEIMCVKNVSIKSIRQSDHVIQTTSSRNLNIIATCYRNICFAISSITIDVINDHSAFTMKGRVVAYTTSNLRSVLK